MVIFVEWILIKVFIFVTVLEYAYWRRLCIDKILNKYLSLFELILV